MNTFPGLPAFKKMTKSKHMKRFVRFDGRVGKSLEPVPATNIEKQSPDLLNQRQEQLAKTLHDDELAKRVIDLQKRFPYGDVPEMLVMDWLDKNKYVYIYQAQVNGGFRSGGHVPDFLMKKNNGTWEAVLVNGVYWHRFPEKNLADKLALTGSYYQGHQIDNVVIVWETRLMASKDSRDRTMAAASQGIELPK